MQFPDQPITRLALCRRAKKGEPTFRMLGMDRHSERNQNRARVHGSDDRRALGLAIGNRSGLAALEQIVQLLLTHLQQIIGAKRLFRLGRHNFLSELQVV